MKNSKEYSKKIKSFYRGVKKKYGKVSPVFYEEPVEAIINGIIFEDMLSVEAEVAIKQIGENFLDYNDLRVSLTEEILEAIGKGGAARRDIANQLSRVLNLIFNEYNSLSLQELHKIGKRPARQEIEKIEGLGRFVIDYCMLTSFHGHAIPLTQEMIEYLESNELVYPGSEASDIEGFLLRQISASEGYEFYCFMRKASEENAVKKKKKAKKKVTASEKKSKKVLTEKTVKKKKPSTKASKKAKVEKSKK